MSSGANQYPPDLSSDLLQEAPGINTSGSQGALTPSSLQPQAVSSRQLCRHHSHQVGEGQGWLGQEERGRTFRSEVGTKLRNSSTWPTESQSE